MKTFIAFRMLDKADVKLLDDLANVIKLRDKVIKIRIKKKFYQIHGHPIYQGIDNKFRHHHAVIITEAMIPITLHIN